MSVTVVDGYNLLFREEPLDPGTSLQERREEFLRRVDAARVPGQRIVVVFDGQPRSGPRRPDDTGVRVLYSRTPRSADDLIVSLVEKAPRHSVTVLTHDRGLMHRVKSAGGRLGDPAAFLRGPRRARPTGRSEKPPPPKGSELDAWEALFEERRESDPDGT